MLGQRTTICAFAQRICSVSALYVLRSATMEVCRMTKEEEVSMQIRRVIDAQKRKQIDIAAAAGLSWPQWQRRISGVVAWRVDEVRAVARALGVPVNELMGDT